MLAFNYLSDIIKALNHISVLKDKSQNNNISMTDTGKILRHVIARNCSASTMHYSAGSSEL